jgi:hypothetical protein
VNEQKKTSVLTWSGVMIDLENPSPEDIKAEDIAWSLSRQYRFRGALGCNYSVAQHSVFLSVCDGLHGEERKWALLHDAGEAYLCDLPNPAKKITDLGAAYSAVERKILLAIAARFGLPAEIIDSKAVAKADGKMVAWEVRRLCKNKNWTDIAARDPAAWLAIWGDSRVADENLGNFGKENRWAWIEETSRRAWLQRAKELQLV